MRRYKLFQNLLLYCTAILGLPIQGPVKREYVIGGFVTESEENFLKHFSPLFETYLTNVVGPLYDPPITFRLVAVDFRPENRAQLMIDQGKVDLIYNHPLQIACIDSASGWSPIATQRHWILGQEAGGYGSLIISLKSNPKINSLADIRDKKVGVGFVLAAAGFALPWKLLKQNGIDLFAETNQIAFYQSDYARLIQDVLDGVIDVGFTQSGMLEQLFPSQKDKLRFHHLINVSYQGQPYPYLASTELVPTYALLAAPHVPWGLRQELLTALMQLNHSSPEMIPTKLSTWTVPASYEVPRQDALDMGIMSRQGDGFTCIDQFTGVYDLRPCAPGYVWGTPATLARGCAAANLTCPEGLTCLCRPCTLDLPVTIRPLSTDLSTVKACSKMEQCTVGEQQAVTTFVVRDKKQRNITFQVQMGTLGAGECTPVHSPECEISVAIATKGLYTLEVFVDGAQADFSPVLIFIGPRNCQTNGTLMPGMTMAMPSDAGECLCPPGSYSLGASGCILAAVLLPVIIGPAVLLALAGNYFLGRYRQWQRDAAWRIDRKELYFDEPQHVLGRGTFGLVVQARYRNTAVAVKRVLPPPPLTRRASFCFDADPTLAGGAPSGSGGGIPTVQASGGVAGGGNASTWARASSEFRPPPVRRHSLTPSMPGSSGDGGGRSSILQVAGPLATGGRSGIGGGIGGLVGQTELSRLQQSFVQEIRILAHLRHPNIVSLMGAVVGGGEPLLVMELMPLGSLWDLLRNQTVRLEGDMVLQILLGVAKGMSFLHACRPPVIHSDLKASNVLVNEVFQAKVSDLGLSSRRSGRSNAAAAARGTPFWTAPECLAGQPNSLESDVYSFGVMLYEVMARGDPYENEDCEQVLKGVLEGCKRPPVPEGCSFKMKSIMCECWDQDPGKRPTFAELERRLASLDAASAVSTAWIKSIRNDRNSGMMSAMAKCFPPDIADAIFRGEKIPPKEKDMVSVFFSDIVGFTNLSGSIGASKVSDMLDRLYTQFDELAEQHGVFKVETIGDAYLCATNILDDQADSHAARLARFAIDARRAALSTPVDLDDPAKGFVNIRVGLCSGAVTASVIGTSHLKYTLLGDTVNTASRMESTSQPGHIQCSQTTAKLIEAQDPAVPLLLRGEIEVKGKGRMTTYWIGPPETITRPTSLVPAGPSMSSQRSETSGADGDAASNGSSGGGHEPPLGLADDPARRAVLYRDPRDLNGAHRDVPGDVASDVCGSSKLGWTAGPMQLKPLRTVPQAGRQQAPPSTMLLQTGSIRLSKPRPLAPIQHKSARHLT